MATAAMSLLPRRTAGIARDIHAHARHRHRALRRAGTAKAAEINAFISTAIKAATDELLLSRISLRSCGLRFP